MRAGECVLCAAIIEDDLFADGEVHCRACLPEPREPRPGPYDPVAHRALQDGDLPPRQYGSRCAHIVAGTRLRCSSEARVGMDTCGGHTPESDAAIVRALSEPEPR